jgi:hypothetical protein
MAMAVAATGANESAAAVVDNTSTKAAKHGLVVGQGKGLQ